MKIASILQGGTGIGSYKISFPELCLEIVDLPVLVELPFHSARGFGIIRHTGNLVKLGFHFLLRLVNYSSKFTRVRGEKLATPQGQDTTPARDRRESGDRANGAVNGRPVNILELP